MTMYMGEEKPVIDTLRYYKLKESTFFGGRIWSYLGLIMMSFTILKKFYPNLCTHKKLKIISKFVKILKYTITQLLNVCYKKMVQINWRCITIFLGFRLFMFKILVCRLWVSLFLVCRIHTLKITKNVVCRLQDPPPCSTPIFYEFMREIYFK